MSLSSPPDLFSCRKILLLRTDRIGDMLVTTPAIRALRKALPQARLDMVASPLNFGVIRDNPHLDSIFLYALRKPWTWPGTVLTLRKQRYDLLLVFNSLSRSTSRFASWLGVPRRVPMGGLPPQGGQFTYIPPPSGESHVILDMLGKLEAMGIGSQTPHMDFVVPGDMAETMRQRFPHNAARIRLAVFLGNIKKTRNRWPVDKFHELIRRLLMEEQDVDIVLLAGILDEPLLRAFDDMRGHPSLDRFVGTSLQETGAMLQSCAALVASSSGPTHLAAALDVPALTLVTRENAAVWPQLNEHDVCITPDHDRHDMRDIKVDAALDMVRAFLNKARRRARSN